MLTKQDIIRWVDENQSPLIKIADDHWENPEIALKEFRAAKLEADYLEKQGFKITWGSGGMPTAFIAEWGSGRPILGFLGEYDALLNLSQKTVPVQDPVTPGGLGHGCGHNLLGVGALGAVAAVKIWLQDNKKTGTIRYYGCPAEEILAGKVYMARDGAFNDLDAAFNYHPSTNNSVSKGSAVALNNLKFRFHGRAAHAGGSPHLGRSALDAVELMNVGANYLREHVESSTRIHYVITHGGDLPNIVPPEAEVWYFVRAPERKYLDEVTDRIRKIAQGATLMTETTMEEIFHTGCYNVLSNHYLADLQFANMQDIGPIQFTPEEIEFARLLNEQYPKEIIDDTVNYLNERLQKLGLPQLESLPPLLEQNYPSLDEGEAMTGSTDVGDVSWITPLSMVWTTCAASAAPSHNWGFTASCGTSIGHKGMLHAAKVMAASAIDLLDNPEHLPRIRAEFEKAIEGKPYITPLPDHARLPD
jgi:aminobenzoyl-glutamate utilization protein B